MEAERSKLEAAGQQHLLAFHDKGMLNPPQTKQLLNQLQNLDYDKMNQLFETTTAASKLATETPSSKLFAPPSANDVATAWT